MFRFRDSKRVRRVYIKKSKEGKDKEFCAVTVCVDLVKPLSYQTVSWLHYYTLSQSNIKSLCIFSILNVQIKLKKTKSELFHMLCLLQFNASFTTKYSSGNIKHDLLCEVVEG